MQHSSLTVKRNRQGVKVWRLQWRESGHRHSRTLGTYTAMSSMEAMAECQRILDPLSAVTLRRYRMMSAGTLPTMRLGQIVRVPARALERWVEQKTAEIELLYTRAIPEAKEVV